MAALGIIGAVALIAGSILWRGYVISLLWAWFVAGQFGLAAITVPQAIGVALFCMVLMHRYRDGAEAPFGKVAVDAFLSPLLTLGIGAIVRAFL